MLDRQKVETILSRRFPGATSGQVAAAANAIMGLGDEWEEVADQDQELGCEFLVGCSDVGYLARQMEPGATFRLFRRREP